MTLSIRALTITSALLWGGGVLVVGLINLGYPAYGVDFLRMMSSIYPGFRAAGTLGDVIVGTGYAVVDGALGALVFGWLYNGFAVRWTRATR